MQHIFNHNRRSRCQCFFALTIPAILLCSPLNLEAGDYMDSAHGAANIGVYRPNIGDAPPQGFGYSRGNCAHCHEQHASIGGSEPLPTGGASSFALFSENFSGVQSGGYGETDNFCFYCHKNGSAPQVLNDDYSQTFGCAGQGTTSLLATMNQLSVHNLYDIDQFADGTFSWYKGDSNPCNGCHNPHLAKPNKSIATNPDLSVMSRPSDHFSLWGTAVNNETMGDSYNTAYEPPYCTNTSNREPAASSDASAGRANTPDYVALCTDCHDDINQIYSTPLGADLIKINWTPTGDRHGENNARAGVTLKEPYASGGSSFVLSCMDCHEPHGAPNIRLIRRRVNGEDLGNTINETAVTDPNSVEWGYLCKRCHPDDAEADGGTKTSDKWQFTHHFAAAPPYPWPPGKCTDCHDSGSDPGGGMPGDGSSATPISCSGTSRTGACHVHGGEF